MLRSHNRTAAHRPAALGAPHHCLPVTLQPPPFGPLLLPYSWLYENKLTSVPGELGRLSELKRLWLDRNQLTTLPRELGNLSKLQVREWTAVDGVGPTGWQRGSDLGCFR